MQNSQVTWFDLSCQQHQLLLKSGLAQICFVIDVDYGAGYGQYLTIDNMPILFPDGRDIYSFSDAPRSDDIITQGAYRQITTDRNPYYDPSQKLSSPIIEQELVQLYMPRVDKIAQRYEVEFCRDDEESFDQYLHDIGLIQPDGGLDPQIQQDYDKRRASFTAVQQAYRPMREKLHAEEYGQPQLSFIGGILSALRSR